MNQDNIKTALKKHWSDQPLTDKDLTDYANNLLSLFSLLIEADKENKNEDK